MEESSRESLTVLWFHPIRDNQCFIQKPQSAFVEHSISKTHKKIEADKPNSLIITSSDTELPNNSTFKNGTQQNKRHAH